MQATWHCEWHDLIHCPGDRGRQRYRHPRCPPVGQVGFTVLVGARDPNRGAEVAEQIAGRVLQLDGTDADTIARAAADVPV